MATWGWGFSCLWIFRAGKPPVWAHIPALTSEESCYLLGIRFLGGSWGGERPLIWDRSIKLGIFTEPRNSEQRAWEIFKLIPQCWSLKGEICDPHISMKEGVCYSNELAWNSQRNSHVVTVLCIGNCIRQFSCLFMKWCFWHFRFELLKLRFSSYGFSIWKGWGWVGSVKRPFLRSWLSDRYPAY